MSLKTLMRAGLPVELIDDRSMKKPRRLRSLIAMGLIFVSWNAQSHQPAAETAPSNKPPITTGKVFVFLGTSTAGKTTLIEQIKMLNPQAFDFGIDLAMQVKAPAALREEMPEEFAVLAKFADPEKLLVVALDREKRWIKSGLSPAEEHEINDAIERIEAKVPKLPKAFWHQIQEEIFTEILSEAEKGKTVLTDIVDSRSFGRFREIFHRIPTYVFLTYCSFPELSRRMQVRNREADESGHLSNKRVGFPLMQFADLYKPRTKKSEIRLDSLKREDIDQAFVLHFPDHPEKKQKFLEAFGFISPRIAEVEITTRFELGEAVIFNTTEDWIDLKETIQKLDAIDHDLKS